MWKEVPQDEFYAAIGPQDAHPSIMGKWPYTSLYKTRQGAVLGKAEDYLPEGSALTKTRFYLPV